MGRTHKLHRRNDKSNPRHRNIVPYETIESAFVNEDRREFDRALFELSDTEDQPADEAYFSLLSFLHDVGIESDHAYEVAAIVGPEAVDHILGIVQGQYRDTPLQPLGLGDSLESAIATYTAAVVDDDGSDRAAAIRNVFGLDHNNYATFSDLFAHERAVDLGRDDERLLALGADPRFSEAILARKDDRLSIDAGLGSAYGSRSFHESLADMAQDLPSVDEQIRMLEQHQDIHYQ